MCKGANVQGCQCARVPMCKGANVQGCKCARVQMCKNTSVSASTKCAIVSTRLMAIGLDSSISWFFFRLRPYISMTMRGCDRSSIRLSQFFSIRFSKPMREALCDHAWLTNLFINASSHFFSRVFLSVWSPRPVWITWILSIQIWILLKGSQILNFKYL